MHRAILIVSGAVALFSSFFLTLWLMEPNSTAVPTSATGRLSDTERLAAQRISGYAELSAAAINVGLRESQQLKGSIDGVNRVNEREVNMAGWLADTDGNGAPLHILVFVGGQMVAMSQTKGERPDVTAAIGLAFGAEKNVVYSFNFNCSPGTQPVVVGVGDKGRYIPLQSKKCP